MKQKSESEDKNWRDCAVHHDFDALISIAAGLVKKRSQVNTADELSDASRHKVTVESAQPAARRGAVG